MDSLLATSTIESIGIFINDYSFWSAFIIAAAFFVRGEVATLLSVYLIQQGLIGWPKVFLIGILSIAFQDVVVYYIGRYGQKTKLGAYLESKFRGAEKLKSYLHKNTTKALILTKFTVGFGSLTIMMSGWSKINFKKFLKINIIADTLWFVMMVILSFLLIQAFDLIDASQKLDSVGLVIGGLVVGIFLAEYLVNRFISKKTGIEEEITEA